MKIRDVEAIVVYTPEPSMASAPGSLIVKVETEDGLVGVGEGCSHSERNEASFAAKEIIQKGFLPILKGRDPLEIQKIWHDLYYYSEWYGRRGVALYALSAVDIALWDLAGKILNQPIYNLMGGKFRDKIRVYASLIFNMDDPEASGEEGRRYVDQGYTAVKYGWGWTREKAFGLDADRDEEAVRVIREILGPEVDLMVDVGRMVNWTLPYALMMAERLKKYRIYWLEEPLPQDAIDSYVALTQQSDVWIAAGEGEYTRWGFKDWIVRRAVDVLQPDVSKAGGLSEVKRIVDLAYMWNLMVVPHGFSTAINVAANLQLVATMPGASLLEFRRTESPLISRLVKRPFEAVNGYLEIPDGEGLGIEINEDVLEEYCVDRKR
jgi:L-alanine-DL-glutamate epimerase-like enolase superfamily enzyme